MNDIVSIVGSGTMGNGIAHVFAICPKVKKVFLVDLNESILDKAKSLIRNNLDRQVKKNTISKIDSDSYLEKIIFTTDINQVSASSLIIEAVKEDIEIKKNIFKKNFI